MNFLIRRAGAAAMTAGLAFAFCLPFFSPSVSAADDMAWSFSEGNDPSNRGRATARLVYGVPETDDQLVTGLCEARASTATRFSLITLVADTGRLRNGERVKVRFSGGGIEHEIEGETVGIGNTEERIAGVAIAPTHTDALWTKVARVGVVEYRIPGYRSTTVDFSKGRRQIGSFLNACKSYEDAATGQSGAASAGSSGGASPASDITEKEAFEQAKELSTIEGWEAFLTRFPNGFRGDLARAYVKRLAASGGGVAGVSGSGGGASAIGQGAGSSGSATAQPALVKPTLRTIARGPSTSRWVNLTQRIKSAGNRQAYTASVRVPGVELVTYCVEMPTTGGYGLGAVLRQRGNYPQFSDRIRQGLAARPFVAGTRNREIDMTFSDGQSVPDAAALPRLTRGELGIGPEGGAFDETSEALQSLLSGNEITVGLEPFQATFQLNGSRNAICSVMNRCGAAVPGCGSGRSSGPVAPVSTTTRRPLTCGKNFRLVRGKCVVRQNCGQNAYRNVEGDCFCNRGFRMTNSGKCIRHSASTGQDGPVKCGRGRTWVGAQGRCVCVQSGRVWNGSRCVVRNANTPKRCTGGRTRDPNTGRCGCNGDSAWNGRQCVQENEPPRQNATQNSNQQKVKQAVCGTLQVACSLGQQNACNNFNRNCR